MKKLGLLFAVLVMSILFAVSASAETWGDYEYRILNDGTVEISKYIGNGNELEIPSEIDGKTVTSIGESAFSECHNLKSIVLPDTVTVIERYAFYGCIYLKEIKLSNNLTKICHYAFGACGSLTKIYLPDSLTEVETMIFGLCVNLKEVRLSAGLTDLNSSMFIGCASLEEVFIPANITLASDSFAYCHSLKRVIIENPETRLEGLGFHTEWHPKGITNEEFAEKMYMLFAGILFGRSPEEEEELLAFFTDNVIEGAYFILPEVGIYCHDDGVTYSAEAYANENGIPFEYCHFYEDDWTYDYDNMIRYRKCTYGNCDAVETLAIEPLAPEKPETPAEPDVPTDEETKEPLYVQLFDLIKMFFALIASIFKK